MSTSPAFAATPRFAVAQVSTANTNRDGTGTVATIFSAGTGGSIVERIDVVAVGATTAGMVRLFIHDGTNGRLWAEIAVSAVTPTASVACFTDTIDLRDQPLILPTGYSLRASTHNAETFNVHAQGGDL